MKTIEDVTKELQSLRKDLEGSDTNAQILQSLQSIQATLEKLVSALGTPVDQSESYGSNEMKSIEGPDGGTSGQSEVNQKPVGGLDNSGTGGKVKLPKAPAGETSDLKVGNEAEDKVSLLQKNLEGLVNKRVTEVLKSYGITKVSTQRPALADDSQYDVAKGNNRVEVDEIYAIAKGQKKVDINSIRESETKARDARIAQVLGGGL